MPGRAPIPAYRLPIRIVNEFAWHNLFARNMFLPENDPVRRAEHVPQFTVIDAPSFKADPARHGSRSDCFIYVHLGKQLVLIGGTSYAGEIKKSIFTILNYLLPLQGRAFDALLGERRRGRRHGAVLRPVRHGKDDAVERSGPAAPRRRRARVERSRASSTSKVAATRR